MNNNYTHRKHNGENIDINVVDRECKLAKM